MCLPRCCCIGAGGADSWRETPMAPLGNDRWQAQFVVDALGTYEYTVEGWIDRFASWRHGLSAKIGAGQDVSSELLEGGSLVDGHPADEAVRSQGLRRCLATRGAPIGERMAAALSTDLADAMAAAPDRSRATRYDRVLGVTVERERARFGAWYEMFPRSAGPDPKRSATFDEAAALLPYVKAMGFDVLYLPPIHPIGRSFRKGRNNSLEADPDDPGSPWAIGSEAGGHTAIEPGLGTLAISIGSSRPRAGRTSRSRSTWPTRPRPIIPGSGSTLNGSGNGRTARSSTPRTRRRSIRTSTRSTSSRRPGRRCGPS